MSKRQLLGLWACIAYFCFVLSRLFGRAAWGYLGLASEWADQSSIPKEAVFSLLEAECRLFWTNFWLLGIGVVGLIAFAISVSGNRSRVG